jgi:FixJ family two-component response regulator
MTDPKPVVFIIDDDSSVRESLQDLLQSIGMQVLCFGSPQAFLQSARPDSPGCIVLDIRLPGQSGLEFQRVLTEVNILLPVIFLSGHGDIAMSVQAMKSGAVEFLTKPVREQQLLDAVQAGLERDRQRRSADLIVVELRQRYESLTPREREVLALVITGRQNKQVAAVLEVSEVTVKVHRSQLMRKMRAKSVVDLVRMTDKLGILTKV